MEQTEQLPNAPPRNLTVPQMPTPQTVSGILTDSGLPSDPVNITDIGPDYNWMAGIEEYHAALTVNSGKTGVVAIIYPQSKFPNKSNPTLIDLDQVTWHWLPFCASKWWNGVMRIRFMAIKPPRVPCKLLIRYTPDVSDMGVFENDKLRRGIKYEWDLAMSQECSIDISAYNWSQLRPTWVTRYSGADTSVVASDATKFKSWAPHLSQVSMGALVVEVANPMIPGNIFPDNIRIMVFQSFPQAEFHVATDPRSMKYHFFFLGSPWLVDGKTLYPT